LTGDVDAVVDVVARDQSLPYQFVRIVEFYRDAGPRVPQLVDMRRAVDI